MTATSKADVDQATAGGAGVAVGADQQTGGATGAAYSEGGHKAHTDVAVEEAISTVSPAFAAYNQLAVQRYEDRATSNQEKLDNMFFQHMQNAIDTANMVSKDALRDRAIATDRLWNINEDSAFGVQLAAVVAAVVKEVNKQND
jgi:hypothetical protein